MDRNILLQKKKSIKLFIDDTVRGKNAGKIGGKGCYIMLGILLRKKGYINKGNRWIEENLFVVLAM